MTVSQEAQKKKGTSIIFINSQRTVLLVLRDNKQSIPSPNCWDIPGGHVDHGETPLECIIREMEEEIELTLDPETIQLFDAREMPDRIEYTYWKHEDLTIDEIILHEGQYLKWFTLQEIENMDESKIAFGFKAVLLDFFNQAPF